MESKMADSDPVQVDALPTVLSPDSGHMTEHLAEDPLSYRVSFPLRLLICACSSIVVVTVGTLIHRLGASRNIPLGFVVACIALALAVWSARSRAGVLGLAVHLVCSGAPLFAFSMLGPGGSILIVAGFASKTIGWWGQNIGIIWILAVVVIHLILLACPKRWFAKKITVH